MRWADGGCAGLDTVEQDLDVWAAPDRSWHRNDEAEFVERLGFPSHY